MTASQKNAQIDEVLAEFRRGEIDRYYAALSLLEIGCYFRAVERSLDDIEAEKEGDDER